MLILLIYAIFLFNYNIFMSDYILYILAALIFLFVVNRFFSGGRFTAHKPNLWGTIAVVTGGNTGIGKETVKVLAQQGCYVIIGARDTKKSQELVRQLNDKLGKDICQSHYLDLGDLDSIRQFVKNIKVDVIDYLVNNAGVMALPKRTLTKSGFQMQYGINHLGHFYLTSLLWPKLKSSQFFRIINVSSLAHKKLLGFLPGITLNFDDMNFEKAKYDSNMAYSRSKLYNNLFTHAIAEKIPEGKGITMSLHPGVVRTELTRYLITGWKQIGFKLVSPLYCIFTKSPFQGAQTTLSTLMRPVNELKNGGYYADCSLSSQNPLVKKENWDKLWEISERDLKIKFVLE